MINIGVAITLLKKKWVDTHGLAIKEKVAKYISCANGTFVKIMGITSTTLLLAPTLKLDVSKITIFSGNCCQGLLGCDLLCWHNKVLGMATITLPWSD